MQDDKVEPPLGTQTASRGSHGLIIACEQQIECWRDSHSLQAEGQVWRLTGHPAEVRLVQHPAGAILRQRHQQMVV